MNENMELLMHIYETAEMGSYTITTLINKLKNKDNKIKYMLEKEIKEYEKYMKITSKVLNKNKLETKNSSIMAKIGSNIGISKETLIDNSDSRMAQMLIEGITMGIVTINSKIESYKNITDKSILKIAKNFLKFQEKEIEKLKKYV